MATTKSVGLMFDKMDRLARACVENSLEGRDILADKSNLVLYKSYNGIGPDFSSLRLLNIMRHIREEFEPAGLIQDLQYIFEKDREHENFARVNEMFYRNCVRLAKAKYSLFSVRRYMLMYSAYRLMKACFTIDAWGCWLAKNGTL